MRPIIIANWKATKTIKEAVEWAQALKEFLVNVKETDIVVCPPFNELPLLAPLFQSTRVKIGAQDVSRFERGAYTGEVTAEMLSGLVTHCIVGHSERRRYFGETDTFVIEKVNRLLRFNITPVLCVSELVQLDAYIKEGKTIIENTGKIIFVYEPPAAISGGGAYHPESPEEAEKNAGVMSTKIGKRVTTLYGGSVNADNIASFLVKEHINGALVGQASTQARSFQDLISRITKKSVLE